MAAGGGGEKTEKATPKRKRDERKKGNVFSSKDLAAAGFLLIMLLAFKGFGKLMLQSLYDLMSFWFSVCDGSYEVTREALIPMLTEGLRTVAVVAGPPLILSILVNVLLTGAQTRFLFTKEAIKFKFSRLNPLEGIKKLFSLRSAVELVKSLLKIAVVAGIIYNSLSAEIAHIAMLSDVDVGSAVLYTCSVIYSTIMNVAVVFILLGIVDFAYQWWEYEKNLRMTKQEIKEEYKQMEGDPQIKGKIKQRQREMAQRRMMQDVPKADVIIRNPTHYAVAILYDPEKHLAPAVVAKGADNIAMKIIEIAENNGVLMTENRPLARALYEKVDIGREIPSEYYQTVAEILAWVYDIKNKPMPY